MNDDPIHRADVSTDPAARDALDGASFRRPERPARPAGEAHALDADGGVPASGADALAPLGAGASRALAEPLAALAAAFHANAEALRKSQETTARLGEALQRADRSEALIQSTGALNETFRGLTNVQRSLQQRIDTSDKAAASGRWFLPVLFLAGIAVLGLLGWLIVGYVDQWRQDAIGTADIGTQLSEQYKAGLAQGRTESQTLLDAERAASADRIRRLEETLRAAETERDAKRDALDKANGALESLRGEVASARTDSLKLRALEDEATRLRAEAVVKDPEIERLRRELSDEKRASAALRQRLADVGLGRAGQEPDPSAPPPPPDPATTAEAATAPDPTLVRDRRSIDTVRGRLNDLLQATAGTRPDYLQIGKIGAIGAQRLVDVVAMRYAPGGKLQSSIRAKELRIVIDRLRRVVELQFAEGALELNGSSVPFPGGTFSAVVAEGDSISSWSSSGLTVVTSR
jgi:hypothetical protein